MKQEDLTRAANPATFAATVTTNRPEPAAGGHHHGPMTSIRTDTYRGHQIVVRTTYEIEIDGRPVTGHIEVSNAGQVHYHPLPNYGFDSAVDMARTLIDTFPEDFPKPAKPKRPSGQKPPSPHEHSGH